MRLFRYDVPTKVFLACSALYALLMPLIGVAAIVVSGGGHGSNLPIWGWCALTFPASGIAFVTYLGVMEDRTSHTADILFLAFVPIVNVLLIVLAARAYEFVRGLRGDAPD